MTPNVAIVIAGTLACLTALGALLDAVRLQRHSRRVRREFLNAIAHSIKLYTLFYTDGRPFPTLRDHYDDPFSAAIAAQLKRLKNQ